MISKAVFSQEFVGRRAELDFLAEEFQAATECRLRFVTIEGEAGIGKSRLLAEFLSSVAHQATIAVGRCSEHVGAPYLPFKEIFQRLDHRSRMASLGRRGEASATEEKWAYFNAVSELLSSHGARRPLVIAIEDAQWADSGSVDLLRFILAQMHALRCLLIVTLRTDSFAKSAAAAAIRSAASRSHSSAVQLRGLRRHEIKRLVQSCTAAQTRTLPQAMVAQIEDLAEGSPLFAEELARVALENGALAFQVQMPVTLQAILSERLASFSVLERGILYRAAVVGENFDAALVAAIADSTVAEVLALLERAVYVGLVSETDSGRFCFRHALIRQVLADQLLLPLASPIHERIAQQLAARPDATQRAPELAYHWAAARIPDQARRWNQSAGDAAWDAHAYRDAIRFYTEALRWKYPQGTARAALYERLGTLVYIEGCGDEPARWFACARTEYQQAGNAVGAAHALLREADQHWVDARTTEALDASLRAADCLKRLGYPQMHAQALVSVARYAVTLGHIDQTLVHLEAAALHQQRFDPGSRAAWHEVRGETHAVLGRAKQALADFRSAAALAAESGVSELISQIENNFALAAFDLGDLDLAMARHQIAVDEAHRTGMMWRIGYCSLNYARTLMFKGQLERAREMARIALETGVTTATFKTKAASVGIPLALLLNDRALLEACSDDKALELAQSSGEIQRTASVAAAFAALRVAQGSAAEARSLLTETIRSIPHAHRAWDLFIAIARFGDPDDIAPARRILTAAVGRPVLRRAYTLLFDALTARRNNAAGAQRLANVAARAFARMGNVLCSDVALRGEDHKQAMSPPALTERQRQIAALVAHGETNRGIAEQLHISEHTVEHHLSGIFQRLGLRSRTQLAHVIGREERE